MSTGVFPRWRARLFGERDPVADQLRDLERQGRGMARIAHIAAFLLIVSFSLGSLVALAGFEVETVWHEFRHGVLDIPKIVTGLVSLLLVLCMDIAMLYATTALRVLIARRAEPQEKRVHQVMIVAVSLMEALTYGYMSWLFDVPKLPIVWVIIGLRAIFAPPIATYLSSARAFAVEARDIMHVTALAAGAGVVRDVLTIAANQDAPLSAKAAIFRAAAVMPPEDSDRLDQLLYVAQAPAMQAIQPPTGPGSPSVSLVEVFPEDDADLVATGTKPDDLRKLRRRTALVARKASAFALLDHNPRLTRTQLAQALGCRFAEASRWYREWSEAGRGEQAQ